MTKIEALARHLECEQDDLTQQNYDENTFKIGSKLYLVLTEEEADDLAEENIKESVWAFNADFLAAHSDIDSDVIKSIQDNGKCEDNNKVLTKLIQDMDHFIDDAIKCDGRGHFLNTYDSEEHEVGNFLIYRTN